MPYKRPSIKAIAKDLSISATTISFILNGKAVENRISQPLIDRVQAHIKKIGYQPSQLAKSLRTGKSNIIVFMVEDISNPFFASIAKSIEERAFVAGYTTIYCSTNNDPAKTLGLIRLFRDLRVDGYIITPPDGLDASDIKIFFQEGKPVVFFDRHLPDVKCSHVVIDNFQGTSLGLSLFIKKGYKKIGFITLDSEQSQMHDRMKAYHQLCSHHQLEQRVLKVPFNSYSSEDSELLMAKFLLEHQDLEAIFFATNYLAMTGMKLFKQLKIKIPEELAVIAFDDNEFFKFNKPSVTSIVQPQKELAQRLIQIMLKLLDPATSEEVIYREELSATLTERESTGICMDHPLEVK